MTPSGRSITWSEMERARRRLAAEEGTLLKDWGGNLPFALAYPNSYYIGMSNLGLQAIYGWLNSREGALCERVFWDPENARSGALPVSVESQRPLNDFAVAAFSLNYEIDYFHIAPLLRASGLPVFSRERDESHPLIIAGGPCVSANPQPVAPFFDALFIGEAEALLPALLPVLRSAGGQDRPSLLQELAKLPGVYVPSFPPKSPVKRQWVQDLADAPTHSVVLTRDTELKDLYLVEVERGCAHGCRFCLVSNTFSPMRFHPLESLLSQCEAGLRHRRRIGLVGPAVTDHPQIEDLLSALLKLKAGFSPSSLRLSSLTGSLMQKLVAGGLRSMALAPEAGSQCLREVIKKRFSEEQVLAAVGHAAEAGIQQMKLYFMIGLPAENAQDVSAIPDLVLKAKGIIEKRRARTRIVLNIAPFVPKANTPFQWLPMAPLNLIEERLSRIKHDLANQGVEVKNESPQWSEVQAVLSRGGAELAQALAGVSRVSLPAWRDALAAAELDITHYAHERWSLSESLPWDFIRSGADTSVLADELTKATS